MGTRALTIVKDAGGAELCVLYRQHDGYPECHGKELAEFLQGREIVNGIPMTKDKNKLFNGMGCLAASLVAHFKKGVGSFYLYPAGTRDVGEEYIYIVTGNPGDAEASVDTIDVYANVED